MNRRIAKKKEKEYRIMREKAYRERLEIMANEKLGCFLLSKEEIEQLKKEGRI